MKSIMSKNSFYSKYKYIIQKYVETNKFIDENPITINIKFSKYEFFIIL